LKSKIVRGNFFPRILDLKVQIPQVQHWQSFHAPLRILQNEDMPMKAYLSPKEVASVIGVSESSLRRWADEGRLEVTRTAGGHRRIATSEAVRFIRESGMSLANPEVLGLGDLDCLPAEADPGDDPGAADRLFNALVEGEVCASRGMVMSWYLAGQSLPAICDGPLRSALTRIGELWKTDPKGVFIEHRAVDICLQTFRQLRMNLIAPADDAPVAVGGSLEEDPYIVPNVMAATVLADLGFRDVNLGAHSPISALTAAIEECQPTLAWLSVMAPTEPTELRQAIGRMSEALAPLGATLIVGGREAPGRMPGLPANVHLGQNMTELAAFGKGLVSRALARPEVAGRIGNQVAG
jgi:excisionase family DNA binding protein